MSTKNDLKIKLFGYTEYTSEDDYDSSEYVHLREVTLAASPQVLRRIAKFMEYTANEIEKYGDDFGHRHLGDYDKEISNSPAFVLVAPLLGQRGIIHKRASPRFVHMVIK